MLTHGLGQAGHASGAGTTQRSGVTTTTVNTAPLGGDVTPVQHILTQRQPGSGYVSSRTGGIVQQVTIQPQPVPVSAVPWPIVASQPVLTTPPVTAMPTCPSGYTYDPSSGQCIQPAPAQSSTPTWLPWVLGGAGVVLLVLAASHR